MLYLTLSAFLIFAAYPLVGTMASVWLLVCSQLVLLIGEVRRRQVRGAGAFIFMSFLFLGMRPIYLLLENDYQLFTKLFLMRVGVAEVSDALWWASAALLCFALGAAIFPHFHMGWLRRRYARNSGEVSQALVSTKMCAALMAFQVMTLPVMVILARGGRSLYGSALGAYAYDAPVVMQAVHILTIVALFERFRRQKVAGTIALLGVSVVLFLLFTWLMRNVSMFRGFYIAGVMIVGIAVLQRWKGRVGYAWLMLPILLLQPFFQYLGQSRGAQNEQLLEEDVPEMVFKNRTLGEAYWRFYDSGGDMNIFDTFVAAKQTEPAFKPYAWSWLYVPLHLVPRAFWKGKPKQGVTMDMSFARGAPYSPGIAGFFLRDGGLFWMLLSMFVLGYLISGLDWFVFTMPRGYLQYCLIGVVTINAMFLTRFFLWQYFYQMLYATVPIVALSWLFRRNSSIRRSAGKNQRRSMVSARSHRLSGAE